MENNVTKTATLVIGVWLKDIVSVQHNSRSRVDFLLKVQEKLGNESI